MYRVQTCLTRTLPVRYSSRSTVVGNRTNASSPSSLHVGISTCVRNSLKMTAGAWRGLGRNNSKQPRQFRFYCHNVGKSALVARIAKKCACLEHFWIQKIKTRFSCMIFPPPCPRTTARRWQKSLKSFSGASTMHDASQPWCRPVGLRRFYHVGGDVCKE